MTIMKWNNSTSNYEAQEDGHLVEVDGDVFAEARADRMKELVEGGTSEDAAYEQADNELLDTFLWTGSTPMHGVSIDGIAQE